jgi:DNA-directed RNA polymerase sigma subunit (sigma70/sigma32)
MNLTRERIRQIEIKAMHKLRFRFNAKYRDMAMEKARAKKAESKKAS